MVLEVFSDGFEDGAGSAWPTRTGAFSVTPEAAHDGEFGLRLEGMGASGAHFATSTVKWAQTNRPYAHIDVWLRCLVVPELGTSMGLITLQNTAGVNHFDIFVSNASGALRWDLEGATSWHDSGIVPEIGRWYHVEAIVFYGDSTYWADVRIDGEAFPRIESPGSAPSTVRSLHLGSHSGAQGAWDVDSVSITVSDEPLSLPELPSPASVGGPINEVMRRSLRAKYGPGTLSDLLRRWAEDEGSWNVPGAWGREARSYWSGL